MTTNAVAVAAVREFNRFYTNASGILREGYLDSGRSLVEARVLFELGREKTTETRRLRETLDLDRGYVSRKLARLEADDIVALRKSSADARCQEVELTVAGRRLLATLQRRSDEQAGELIAGLGEADRERLVAAMARIRSLLGPRPQAPRVALRDLRIGELGWVVERHGVLYCEEWGWGQSFEGLVAGIVAEFAQRHDPGRERGWVAEVDGERAGAIFCTAEDGETARLRMLFVEPWARGARVGARLIEACVDFARAAGYRRMVLWTTDQQVAARRLYQAAGFERVSEYPDPRFGSGVTSEDWRLPL
ncbi:MAG: bifunctional helix-turn-helix transcriptional regulator/GNAT family N-acetyltransferase [Solirubrobacterales bacterium]